MIPGRRGSSAGGGPSSAGRCARPLARVSLGYVPDLAGRRPRLASCAHRRAGRHRRGGARPAGGVDSGMAARAPGGAELGQLAGVPAVRGRAVVAAPRAAAGDRLHRRRRHRPVPGDRRIAGPGRVPAHAGRHVRTRPLRRAERARHRGSADRGDHGRARVPGSGVPVRRLGGVVLVDPGCGLAARADVSPSRAAHQAAACAGS